MIVSELDYKPKIELSPLNLTVFLKYHDLQNTLIFSELEFSMLWLWKVNEIG